MVPGGIRNIHEGKVTGQMANAANHHSDRHGTEDYLNIVQRLGNEVWIRYSLQSVFYILTLHPNQGKNVWTNNKVVTVSNAIFN